MATDVYAQNTQQPTTYSNGWQFDPSSGQYISTVDGRRMSSTDYNGYAAQQEDQARQDAAAKKNAADMAAQGLNPDGSPIRKDWQSLVDPATGKLKEGYTMDIKALDPTTMEGYQKYKQEALRTGPSAWAGLQNQQQDYAAQATKEAAARQAMSSMNQGNSNLAMHGGLSAGAMGLAARASGRDLLNSRQAAARNATTNKMGIATTDEQNRIGQLANLSASEQSLGQFNKTLEGKQQEYNIGNLLQEEQGKRSYNDLTYQEQMKKWAAAKQADATSHSGGGGK